VSGETRTDAELLAAAGRGDDAAFAALVRRYIRAATLLAAQLVGDQDDAEDVVQDSFTVVHKNARVFDAGRPFGPWFFAIVRRLATNRRSRERRRKRLLQLWWGGAPTEATTPAVDRSVIDRIEADVAAGAMANLSPMQRACFELVAVRDLSPEEVAAMHGIAESTVRQHVFRARAALRGALDGGATRRSESLSRPARDS
jgi:RNA polymerase sigma-70 factor (ECF subfamily)